MLNYLYFYVLFGCVIVFLTDSPLPFLILLFLCVLAHGFYAFTESLRDSAYNDESFLLSGLIEPSTNQCLSFWYHMYGEHINTLTVFQRNSEHTIELWSKSGDQGYKWCFQSLPLKHIGPYQIVFKAIRGYGDRSDIAIDDISIINTICNKGRTLYYNCYLIIVYNDS